MNRREQLIAAIKESLQRNNDKDEWLSSVGESAIDCCLCPISEYCEREMLETTYNCFDVLYEWLKTENG